MGLLKGHRKSYCSFSGPSVFETLLGEISYFTLLLRRIVLLFSPDHVGSRNLFTSPRDETVETLLSECVGPSQDRPNHPEYRRPSGSPRPCGGSSVCRVLLLGVVVGGDSLRYKCRYVECRTEHSVRTFQSSPSRTTIELDPSTDPPGYVVGGCVYKSSIRFNLCDCLPKIINFSW